MPSSFDMEAAAAHRSWQHSALPKPGRHRALPMDPRLTLFMAFERNVIVISRDDRFPAQARTNDGLNDGAHLFRHCPSACVCEASCPGGIAEVLGPLVACRIQYSQASADVFTLSQVVIANRRADLSGPAVDHQPQATILIAL